jgi:hypothetical protein
MAGKIIADTLETGAGADIATSYVVDGSLKAHVLATNAAVLDGDSDLNISSGSDDGTGDYTINLTSAMSGSRYVISGSPETTNDRGFVFDSATSTSFAIEIHNVSGSLADPSDGFSSIVAGDLA